MTNGRISRHILCRRSIPGIKRPRPPPGGDGYISRPVRTCGLRNQQTEDSRYDMHAWENTYAINNGVVLPKRDGNERAEDWETRKVVCHQCNKEVQARNLTLHLNTQHNIYPQTSVDADLLADRPSVVYRARVPNWKGKLGCPVPGCLGELRDSYNLRRHFRDLHPKDEVIITADGRRLPRCPFC